LQFAGVSSDLFSAAAMLYLGVISSSLKAATLLSDKQRRLIFTHILPTK
jgi:hypothetical protein